ncbi:hypothetical protein N1030_13600 [Desulfovibrio mangrovi]|uniref:DUF6785 family protein n=1 Tax=Desulfovibrio mangrovi TaxID=2976983 RepID=UPI0022476865|nr:DUF6785 family protein [Desulfovibrio mangrovi]UZP66636.1 hypothetical protein N1030_13600 [Desulfovibrio mangrovi]
MNGLRIHSLLLGMVLALGLCAAGPFNTAWLAGTPLGGGHFPLAPFALSLILFAATMIDARLRKVKPAINGLEQLVIWLFMVVGTGIGYAGLVETFFLNITAPVHYAKDELNWVKALAPYLPDAWYLHDPAAVKTLYNGVANGRGMPLAEVATRVPWGAWLPVLFLWSAFILLAYATMLCIVNLFGRQWVENERVNFPLLRVPQLMAEMLDNGKLGDFFTNRYLLWGVAIPVMLHGLNGLHQQLPSVPEVPLLMLAGKYFPKFGLFSGFHKLKLYIVPAFIGFAFLTTRQIAFSFWVFYLLGALFMGVLYVFGLEVPEAAMGITFGPNLARPAEAQVIGAYFIFFCFMLWLARAHIASVARSALTNPLAPIRSGEFMSAGLSFWGALTGTAAMCIWCLSFGMSVAGSVLLPATFFVVLLVTSRLIAQGGLPQFMLSASPVDSITGLFGSRLLGPAGLVTGVVMQKVLFLDIQESLMPTLVHGAKVAEGIHNRRRFIIALGILLVLCVCTAFASMLVLCHKVGIRDLKLDWAASSTASVYDSAARLISSPVGPNLWISIFAGLGAVIMLLLVLGYYRFHWWPLHPLGFLAAYSKSMRVLWFCFLIGWLCNYLVLHYGGTPLYRKVRFFFMGLIVGDILMGGIWAVTGYLSSIHYNVFPLP